MFMHCMQKQTICTVFCFRKIDNIEPEKKEPPKLFRVQRIKPLWGRPYWERRILEKLGLQYRVSRLQLTG